MTCVIGFEGAVALMGRFPALAGADLMVSAGERVLLQGPNGAGKTSLLRAVAGLLPVVAGTAEVLGQDLRADRRGVRRHVGMLGHDNHLYADLWVRDHMRFRAAAVGADAQEVARAMELVELPSRLWRVPTRRLSAGQRRRVALAALVVRRPRLWLLDEPHAGLDARGRDVLDNLLLEASSAGATVVFASHEVERAQAVADRVVDLGGGRVVGDRRVA